ncbi:MAG: 3'-5' exoribonuclease YhaM family protein [Candidatus Brocadiales bacterium]
MVRRYISELRIGEQVDAVFRLHSREIRPYGNGKLSIQAQLADKSGTLPAVMWDASPGQIESFGKEGLLRVQGVVSQYKNSPQLEIKNFSREELPFNLEELFPWTKEDVRALQSELEGIVNSLTDPFISPLLKLFLRDEDFMRKFSLNPASTSYHHAYLGGLLEHTVAVARLALQISKSYPILDRDLLVAGAILHDIGKLRELSYQNSFHYTDHGRLVGHLVSGVLMVEEKAAQIKGFLQERLDLIRHIILSHHGETDSNSPRLPMTAEAIAIHYLDNLDAKLQGYQRALAEDKDPESLWTTRQKMFGDVHLYKKGNK